MALVLALVASLAAAVPAFAQTIEKEWTVEFTGSAMTDQGSADIVKELRGMQPGDSAKFTVVMYEKFDKAADWYMKNKVLESMEKSLRSGGSYSYKLTYTNPKGEQKVIITNEVVSGDQGSGATKGLFDATEATGEYFFLDTLAPQAKALMTLEVAIDGETHGNTYFDSAAQIQLQFAAEPSDQPGTEGDATTPRSEQKPSNQQPEKKLSQTGDTIAMGVIALVAVLAAGVLVVAGVHQRRKKNEEGDAR
ncbi:LPXTG cell wall anchor domain-containing protein [Adlercreutzia sp. R21]|uniref:LPXTG cell wall anchor domain-containing protein n=1 Tax=Adlercreutzia wanghongyangiae TaxID=3111451 RepID=UPI002DBC6A8A|nr:LPXTG cell wall anchor domain-containing protein [Adlercreutzia sp. R21]MEC4184510.1 LPXTG cell wall anchor domain-containing protein [Adlercreutzia sp. R21]